MLGVACSVRLGVERIGVEGVERYRFVGGSSKYPYWNSLLASVLEVPLEVCPRGESSALGAVILGARAVGGRVSVRTEASRVEPYPMEGLGEYFARFKDTYRLLENVEGRDRASTP
jgi:sugar (pentulose or hexulose) kinase